MTPQQMEIAIARNMKALKCSREEAIEIVLFEEQVDKMSMKEVVSDLTPEQRANIKAVTKATKKKAVPQPDEEGKKPTAYKFTKRERKVDVGKAGIISKIFDFIKEFVNSAEIVKPESEIAFEMGGESYSIKLTKHRKPKS